MLKISLIKFVLLNSFLITIVNAQCALNNTYRLDCLPELNSKYDEQSNTLCTQRGCCFDEKSNDLNVPKCYYPENYIKYIVYDINKLSHGFQLKFKVDGNLPIWPPKQSTKIQVNVHYINENILRVQIADDESLTKTFTTDEVLEKPLPVNNEVQENERNYDIDFKLHSFGFTVTRRSTGVAIFNTTFASLIFAHRFKQISTLLPSKHIFGLAERNANLNLYNGKREVLTFFNRGEQPEERNSAHFNLYGYHPYYLSLEDDGNFNGVYLHSNNALDIVLQPETSLTYRTVGGNLDFFFFLGPSADDVISQYTSIIGRPFLPPYWALGFHLCRYDYGSTNNTRTAWQRTLDAGIPFDGQWNDIDYMDKRKNFVINPVEYEGLNDLVADIHKKDMNYIINVSPGLSNLEPEGTYEPFDRALKEKLFVYDPYTNKPMSGKCWQNETVYLDFTNPDTVKYWEEELVKFHEKLNFDALWLDMNEPYNFKTIKEMDCKSDDPLENIPYTPGGSNEPLSNSTLCMYAKMHAGDHFDLHTLYGYYETKATYSALKKIVKEKRPWILSRSNAAGMGRYASHWNGDITAEWPTMKRTIANMLTYNMIGMPLIGADICGFMKNTTADLCARWHQLGAFYTFSRNHNDFDTIDHDPVAMGPAVVNAARESMMLRYKLLPYLYTLFYKSHLFGHAVAKPLFFDNPTDMKTHHIDQQFMWGSAIMFNPVLHKDAKVVETYFPKGHWYSNFQTEIIGPVTKEIESHDEKPNINFKAGHIIPFQEPEMNTVKSRENDFGLYVYIDPETKEAFGELYWDDGNSLELKYTHVLFSLEQATTTGYQLKTEADMVNYDKNLMKLSKIIFFNVKEAPQLVMLNSERIYDFEIVNNQLMITLDEDRKVSLIEENIILVTF